MDAYQGRGDAYDYLEEYQRAIEDYSRALELTPEDAHEEARKRDNAKSPSLGGPGNQSGRG